MSSQMMKMSEKIKVYRPIGCAFLDECSVESFWKSQEGAKMDFPTCEVKEYIGSEIIEYFIESKQNFIRIQGNGDSYQGYLLNENIPEEIKNKYYTLIEDESDLINYIKNDN